MSPLLIMFGYDPKVVVPAILVSEAVSGLWGGAWHAKFKNVDFKVVGFTLLGSLAGMAAASYVIGLVLPSSVAKQYIASIAVLMGIFVVIRSFSYIDKLRRIRGSPAMFSLLGAVTGFNKGGTGGGYGPLSVSGYMLLGLSASTAIGTTTVAEGVACVLGIAIYSQIAGMVPSLIIPITLGSFIADPISAWINNHLKLKLKPPFHGRLIGVAMTGIGIVAFLKNFGII